MSKPLCKHCRARRANRCRGLCSTCYSSPGVLELHPSTSHYDPLKNGGDRYKNSVLPAEPTDAGLGSEAKILVMMERVQRWESPFHPDDSRIPEPTFDDDVVDPSLILKALAGGPLSTTGLMKRFGVTSHHALVDQLQGMEVAGLIEYRGTKTRSVWALPEEDAHRREG